LCMPDSRAPLPPTRLLEQEADPADPALALTASGIQPSTNVQPGDPAPPAEPMELEDEADVEASSMVIGIVVVTVGGSLWALCVWYVLQKRTSAPRRSGPGDSDATSLRSTEVCINVSGDMETDMDVPQKAEMCRIHLTKESVGEKSADVPLL